VETALDLAKALIARPSVTPNDADCQSLIAEQLTPLGFQIEHLRFGEVDNLWARFGSLEPLFVFAGHTDVVPAGLVEQWQTPPFEPMIRDGFLYGRGAADMKGSIAAMVMAAKQFILQNSDIQGSIAFLLTSDEEGAAINGTAKVIEHLQARNENITWCLVGEPSCENSLGDTIKHGRRGSLSGKLTVYGKQGHIAYPQLADNPIHRSLPALLALTQTTWDNGTADFPPTTCQISNIHAGTGASNVIPGQIEIDFNLRYSPACEAEQIKTHIEIICAQQQLNYHLDWQHSGKPFLTAQGELLSACQQAIQEITGKSAKLSTSGGTSDGRFIAPTGCQVVEFGPVNRTIHQVNECIAVDDLERLTAIYWRLLEKLLLR
jgi:succinyl-diaminopimelate desuccinylase